MRWLSARHIERMDVAELAEAVRPFVDRDRFPIPDDMLPAAIEAIRSHLSVYSDVNDHLDAFVPTLDEEAERARDGLLADADAQRVLNAVRDRLATLETWDDGSIGDALRTVGQAIGVRGRALYGPVRIALTGREHGPPLPVIAKVLGRAAVLDLLDQVLGPGREV